MQLFNISNFYLLTVIATNIKIFIYFIENILLIININFSYFLY